MKAIAYGDDGTAGDSGFGLDPAVEADGSSSYEELLARWLEAVLLRDGWTKEDDGAFAFDDGEGEIWRLSSTEEILFYFENDSPEAPIETPEGFWILEDGDLEKILAGSAVECWNDSSAYAVAHVAKEMCAQFAKRTIGRTPEPGASPDAPAAPEAAQEKEWPPPSPADRFEDENGVLVCMNSHHFQSWLKGFETEGETFSVLARGYAAAMRHEGGLGTHVVISERELSDDELQEYSRLISDE